MIYVPANYVNEEDLASAEGQGLTINARLCRNCEYYIPEHPTIDTDGDFGYCEYRTDFNALEEGWPINWYFTNINGFCNENDIR